MREHSVCDWLQFVTTAFIEN